MANEALGFIPDIVLIHGKTTDSEIIPIAVNSSGQVITDTNDKGWFANEAALLLAYPNTIADPTVRDGWYATVGSGVGAPTIWLWDRAENQWEDSKANGLVTSVFGRTGIILPVANDYTWAQINKATSSITDIADVTIGSPAAGQLLQYTGALWENKNLIQGVPFAIHGSNFAIKPGYKGHIKAPFPKCDLVRIDMESSGGAGNTTSVIDIWKCTQAEYNDNATHPAVGDSITAAAKPTITTGVKMTDSTLDGWTKTNFVTGDCFGINVDSNDVAKILIVTPYFKWTA